MLLGNAILLPVTVLDPVTGLAADPATLTLTVTKPDATTDSFNIGALTHVSTGNYSYTYSPATAGAYRYQWTATVPAFSTDGLFNVTGETSTAITLPDVKRHLSITESTHDAALQDLIDAAVGVVEGLIGPLTPKTYSEVYNGGGYRLVLRHAPVVSVSSVVENWGTINYTLTNQPVGQATDAYGYDIDDPEAGILVRRTVGSFPFPFFSGIGNVAVTYTAGRTSVPGPVKLAVLRQIRDLWSDYQSGRTKNGVVSASNAMPYGVSNYVADLLLPYMLMPGIA